jgi:hypothetical protein
MSSHSDGGGAHEQADALRRPGLSGRLRAAVAGVLAGAFGVGLSGAVATGLPAGQRLTMPPAGAEAGEGAMAAAVTAYTVVSVRGWYDVSQVS